MTSTENRLKILRESLGLTQSELARPLQISGAAISIIESGKRQLSDRLAHSLSVEYGVSERWLLTGEGDMFPVHPEDEELIETYALLGAQKLSPQHKQLAIALLPTIASLPDEAIPALRDCLRTAAQALDESPPDAEEKKDEV